MIKLAKKENTAVSYGYFEYEQEGSVKWKLYASYGANKLRLAKVSENNVYRKDYILSIEDIEFIFNSIEKLWKLKDANYQEANRKTRGKLISLSMKDNNMSFAINSKGMTGNLGIEDSRRLYAMLKELHKYGKSNKLSN